MPTPFSRLGSGLVASMATWHHGRWAPSRGAVLMLICRRLRTAARAGCAVRCQPGRPTRTGRRRRSARTSAAMRLALNAIACRIGGFSRVQLVKGREHNRSAIRCCPARPGSASAQKCPTRRLGHGRIAASPARSRSAVNRIAASNRSATASNPRRRDRRKRPESRRDLIRHCSI